MFLKKKNRLRDGFILVSYILQGGEEGALETIRCCLQMQKSADKFWNECLYLNNKMLPLWVHCVIDDINIFINVFLFSFPQIIPVSSKILGTEIA